MLSVDEFPGVTGMGSEQNLLPVQVGNAEAALTGLMGWLWALWFSRGAPKHPATGSFNTGYHFTYSESALKKLLIAN